MKVRKGSILTVVLALAVLASLVAGVGGTVGAEVPLPPDDQWSGMLMPNTQDWNMAPGTDVGPLAMSETGDGTLHAGVYDAWDWDDDTTRGTRWGSPRGVVRWAVFYSTDGGFDWKMGWELPEDDPGPIIDIVQAPGYEHPGWVYMITPWFLYFSSDGGESFTRAQKCPGVYNPTPTGGYLTSLDVVAITDCPICDPYAAVVGVACGTLDGVYAFGIDGFRAWRDMEITNYPAGASIGTPTSVPVYEVRFSQNHADDLGIAAVAYYDPSAIGSAFNTVYTTYAAGATTLVTWFDGVAGTWANEKLDAPFLVSGVAVTGTDYAVLDFADDMSSAAPSMWVGIAGSAADDVWGVKLLPPASGPSSASRLNISGGADQPIDSIVVYGSSGILTATALVGLRDVTQAPVPGVANGYPAQVVRGTNLAVSPSVQWQRSAKPPEGRYDCWGTNPNGEVRDCAPLDRLYYGLVFVVARDVDTACGLSCKGDAHASTGYTGVPSEVAYPRVHSFSGVWHCVESMAGMCWNGTGLLDDILFSSTYLDNGYINYAQVVWEEASPDYANDDTLYFVSWSDWSEYWDETCYANGTLFWWRTMDNSQTWELLYRENTRMVTGFMTGMPDQWVDDYLDIEGDGPETIWSVRTDPNFTLSNGAVSASVGGTGYVFVLGNNYPSKGIIPTGIAWWLWYSPDGGNFIAPLSGMPQLDQINHTYMHTGWNVFDSKTIALGDDQGLVYITTDRANSWTDGVATHYEDLAYVTNLKFSPIYSNDPGAGEDQTILVGLYYYSDSVAEVWISQDGAESDFTMVGTFPGYQYEYCYVSPVMVEFDNEWSGNPCTTVYAAASGQLDEMYMGDYEAPWELYGDIHGDVGIYRTDVVLESPPVSVWEPIYGWQDLEDLLPHRPALSLRGYDEDYDFDRWIWFTALEVGNHNTLYAPYVVMDDWNEDRFTHGGVLRTLDGKAQPVEKVIFDNLVLGLPQWTGLYLLSAVPGSTYLFTIGDRLDYWYSSLRDHRLMGYHDILCEAGPDAASPADKAKGVGTIAGELEKVNVTLDWDAIDSDAPLKYEWQLSDDSKFTTLIADGLTTETFAQVVGLEKDSKYYWRVRVIEPAHSPWSGPFEFTSKKSTLTTQVIAPSMANASPAAGATNVSLRPTLSWGAVGGADYYNLEVATDANFNDLVIDEEVTGTAYTPGSDLAKNTTYYWRVQGCTEDDECSEWSSTGHFTTGPEAKAGTPVWVWVVIVIGAILAIVVIVLIVRTRRPA